jgi:serine/threonine protein phosphatase 1
MRYAISDIHGCPKTLAALIGEIGLEKKDELFLLGDYIDRGPDSQGVINLDTGVATFIRSRD